jgi:Ni2+-binding GTPase involved in maturation of urease and hydrogenase
LALWAVSGACSRSGKTALLESLLRALPKGRAVAVKFTTTEDVFERCPRGTPCVVCDIDVPFRIVTDARTLDQPGTDTERLGQAGAVRVVWAIARESAVAAAWAQVERMIAGAEIAVMEGSTIVSVTQPDVRLFVVHPFLSPERWKPTSGPLIARSDLVVVNRPAAECRPPSAAVMEALRAHRPAAPIVVADVARPPAEWAPTLDAKLRELR